jgi:serine phosphatase RsbU (regulator of sigma subunit)
MVLLNNLNSEKKEFGVLGLEKAILLSKEKSTTEIIESISNPLLEFKQDTAYLDDIALLCLRIK